MVWYMVAIVASSAMFYGLWWLHNPHPLGAAIVAGICAVIVMGSVHSMIAEQTKRIAMLEQRVEELENAEDALYD